MSKLFKFNKFTPRLTMEITYLIVLVSELVFPSPLNLDLTNNTRCK